MCTASAISPFRRLNGSFWRDNGHLAGIKSLDVLCGRKGRLCILFYAAAASNRSITANSWFNQKLSLFKVCPPCWQNLNFREEFLLIRLENCRNYWRIKLTLNLSMSIWLRRSEWGRDEGVLPRGGRLRIAAGLSNSSPGASVSCDSELSPPAPPLPPPLPHALVVIWNHFRHCFDTIMEMIKRVKSAQKSTSFMYQIIRGSMWLWNFWCVVKKCK